MTPLRKERERRNLAATDVAAAIGIDQSHYSKIENCKVIPSPTVADRIAKHFGNAVTRDQILFPHDYMPAEAKAS